MSEKYGKRLSLGIRKNDQVVVIAGKDKGKTGAVSRVLPKRNKIVVEGINMITKHQKPNAQHQKGSLVKKEAPLDRSKVMPYCPTCQKGVRVGHIDSEDGKSVRICKKCSEQLGTE